VYLSARLPSRPTTGGRSARHQTTEDSRKYGVPADLKLGFLHGAERQFIGLDLYQFQFRFYPDGYISVQGEWELRDAAGERIDGRHDSRDRPPYQLHRLLGRRVVGSKVSAPEWFSLQFEGGEVLRIFDDDSHYDSFQIEPGSIIVRADTRR
jgi:hypothetical protein